MSSLYPIVMAAGHELRTVNCYLLEYEGECLLIDTGYHSEACWQALTTGIAAHGFVLRDIKRILLTHSHPDHMGLAQRLASIIGVPIMAHREALPRLRRDQQFLATRIAFFQQLYRSMGCGEAGERQVKFMQESLARNRDQRITGELLVLDDESEVAAGLRALYTPGHAPDHLIFYDSEERRLFAGDLLIPHMSSNAMVEPDADGNRLPVLQQYVNSLQRMMELDAECVYPGHGQPIADWKSLCEVRLHRMMKRAHKILSYIAKGVEQPNEIAVAYYKELYERQFAFVMSDLIGYLDYLELQGSISKEMVNGVWRYRICDE